MRSISKRLTVPLWYTGLGPGTKVNVRALNATSDMHVPMGFDLPTAANPRPLVATGERAAASEETHVLGGDVEAGFTDIVLDLVLAPASYAVLVVTVAV